MANKPDLRFINEKAAHEAWGIFENDTGLQLQRIDFPEGGIPAAWSDDDGAWEHVCRKALEGSDLHLSALLYLKGSEETDPEEWQRINTHAVHLGLIAPCGEIV